MNATILIAWTLAVGLTMQTDAAAEPTKTNTGTIGPNKGLTLEDIGKGLKSAAQNIENEIPKIGPAIGETFKKVTGKESEKQYSHPEEKK